MVGIAIGAERIIILESFTKCLPVRLKEVHMCKGCGCLRGKTTTTVVEHDHEHSHGDLTHSHPHDHDHEHSHDEKAVSSHEDHKH